MGNRVGKIGHCFAGDGDISRRYDTADILLDPVDEGFGHSFCYIRPDPCRLSSSSKFFLEDDIHPPTTFRLISGASVSANASTPLSTSLVDLYPYSTTFDRAAAFDCSDSFSSIPLQPVPRNSISGISGVVPGSGPIERGFLSGPIERSSTSGPIDRASYSGPIGKGCEKLQRSLSDGGFGATPKLKKRNFIRILKKAIAKTISRSRRHAIAPTRGTVSAKESDSSKNQEKIVAQNSTNLRSHTSLIDEDDEGVYFMGSRTLQWAHGKAGEDRVHVVISEESGWVFVGIYDGFNGPDAPDYLLANLYTAVHKELKGLLWNDKNESTATSSSSLNSSNSNAHSIEEIRERLDCPEWEETAPFADSEVLNALSQALRKTEDAYLEIADKSVARNPELALMGSCVLVMLMKGEDVYLMNVGDSRAVLAQQLEPDYMISNQYRDFERTNIGTLRVFESSNGVEFDRLCSLTTTQLTLDHSTNEEEEVQRIKREHPDDASAVLNDRVKGYLKITRAFGAGFLKQPKWNNALLEMFRIDYVGNSPYITCNPTLFHHKLSPIDKFLILSSDGLYQYFTNEEAVSQVEFFLSSFPDGDPAQHLIEEVLFRAAKKAGMDFHELLEIPQGERRKYHDDVSVIIITFEGRIWRSGVN